MKRMKRTKRLYSKKKYTKKRYNKKGGRRFNDLTEEEYDTLISYGFTLWQLDALTSPDRKISEGIKLLNNTKSVPEDRFFIYLRNLQNKIVQEHLRGRPLSDEDLGELKLEAAAEATHQILEQAEKLYREYELEHVELDEEGIPLHAPMLVRHGGSNRRKKRKTRRTWRVSR